jgi:hypothetical protein
MMMPAVKPGTLPASTIAPNDPQRLICASWCQIKSDRIKDYVTEQTVLWIEHLRGQPLEAHERIELAINVLRMVRYAVDDRVGADGFLEQIKKAVDEAAN